MEKRQQEEPLRAGGHRGHPIAAREAELRHLKELGDALVHREALLRALDELESCVSEQYDPLGEEVEKLKLEEQVKGAALSFSCRS